MDKSNKSTLSASILCVALGATCFLLWRELQLTREQAKSATVASSSSGIPSKPTSAATSANRNLDAGPPKSIVDAHNASPKETAIENTQKAPPPKTEID